MPEAGPDVHPFEDWQPLAKNAARWHVAWSAVLVLLVPAAYGLVRLFARKLDRESVRAGAAALLVLLLLNVVRTFVWMKRFRYRITPSTVETRSIVLSVTTRVVPLGRIQHVDVSSGPVERMLGISNVSAHTAAGDSTIVVPGVPVEIADRLRDLLLRERRGEAV
jgi:membrane protein YdbS with pleckstrin-like domain